MDHASARDDNLHVCFDTRAGTVQALRGVSLTVAPGERSHRRRIRIREERDGTGGNGPDRRAGAHLGRCEILWEGKPLAGFDVAKAARDIWGREITMNLSEPDDIA